MRYYIYEVHTDQSRNRLLNVFKDEAEAGVMDAGTPKQCSGNRKVFYQDVSGTECGGGTDQRR
ncbi:hypothetical protein LVY75_35325 (plasmid) [Sinorhizobium sp. B11]